VKEMNVVEVGTRVVVESEKVGVEQRSGMVTGVNGALVRVRWDSGEETSFVPAAGAMRVVHGDRNSSGEH
jgi:hypothetical protein